MVSRKGYALNKEKTRWESFGKQWLWADVQGEFVFNRNEVNNATHVVKAWIDYKDWHVYWLVQEQDPGVLNWDVFGYPYSFLILYFYHL